MNKIRLTAIVRTWLSFDCLTDSSDLTGSHRYDTCSNDTSCRYSNSHLFWMGAFFIYFYLDFANMNVRVEQGTEGKNSSSDFFGQLMNRAILIWRTVHTAGIRVSETDTWHSLKDSKRIGSKIFKMHGAYWTNLNLRFFTSNRHRAFEIEQCNAEVSDFLNEVILYCVVSKSKVKHRIKKIVDEALIGQHIAQPISSAVQHHPITIRLLLFLFFDVDLVLLCTTAWQ